MTWFFLLNFGCTTEEEVVEKHPVDPIELPLNVKNVVIVPYTMVDSDSYLQCIPDISGADAATLVVSYSWVNLRNEVTLGDGFELQLNASMVEPNDEIDCRVAAVDYREIRSENKSSVLIERVTHHLDQVSYTFEGERASDKFGIAMSLVGDVDADGRVDFMVASPNNSLGEIKGGKSYLFTSLGDSSITPTQSFYGETIKDFSGTSISGAGDVDGDGLEDLIFGAIGNDEEALEAGKAYLYFGESYLFQDEGLHLQDADHLFWGESPHDYFGTKVLGAGDVDGDLFDDFLVASPGNKENGYNTGKVYLFFGDELGSGVSPREFMGESSYDQLGMNMVKAGDVDMDGMADFWLAAPGGATSDGLIYLMKGRNMSSSDVGIADNSLIVSGEGQGDAAGSALVTGDVDGDGKMDLFVGAPYRAENGYRSGKAYLVLADTFIGLENMSLSDADYSFLGEEADDRAGASLAILDDVDQDGLPDIIIGSPGNNQYDTHAGKVYYIPSLELALGQTSLQDVRRGIVGEKAYDFTGETMLSLGDYDGDGKGDFLLGAPMANGIGADSGKVYFIPGSML